jgi:hypothetical protein
MKNNQVIHIASEGKLNNKKRGTKTIKEKKKERKAADLYASSESKIQSPSMHQIILQAEIRAFD